MVRSVWGCLLCAGVLSCGVTGAAAQTECFPACREGYACVEGQCVSACNPPCAQGERCTAQAECVPGSSQTMPPQGGPPQGPPPQGQYQQGQPPQGQYPQGPPPQGQQGAPPQGGYQQSPPPQGAQQPPQGWVAVTPGSTPVPPGGGTASGVGRWPVRYTDRTLTLPAKTLHVFGGLGFDHFPGTDDMYVSLGTALAYGIVDQVEIQASFLNLLLSPEVEYGNPYAGAVFAFNKGKFQAGGFVRLHLPVRENTGFSIDLGIPLEVGSRVFRFETGFILSITPPYTITGTEGAEYDTDLSTVQSIPLHFAFQFGEIAFMRINTGWAMADGEPDTSTIPWGADVGFTVPGADGPLVDLTFGFDFPAFIVPDADEVGYTERWHIGLGADFYIFL